MQNLLSERSSKYCLTRARYSRTLTYSLTNDPASSTLAGDVDGRHCKIFSYTELRHRTSVISAAPSETQLKFSKSLTTVYTLQGISLSRHSEQLVTRNLYQKSHSNPWQSTMDRVYLDEKISYVLELVCPARYLCEQVSNNDNLAICPLPPP